MPIQIFFKLNTYYYPNHKQKFFICNNSKSLYYLKPNNWSEGIFFFRFLIYLILFIFWICGSQWSWLHKSSLPHAHLLTYFFLYFCSVLGTLNDIETGRYTSFRYVLVTKTPPPPTPCWHIPLQALSVGEGVRTTLKTTTNDNACRGICQHGLGRGVSPTPVN